jgi:hypothetical protein
MLYDACRAVAIARHFTLSKLQRLLPSLVCNASFHRASLLCFGLLFVRKRLGGAALVAELVKRLLAGGPDQRAASIMNRVYGARGVHVVVRRMRAGMSRMLHTHPICSFGARLQVEASIWLGCAWL